MYNNWYQKKTKKTKRKPIVLAKGDSFDWKGVNNIDGSYNVVTVGINDNIYNFYLWSEKTTKNAKKLHQSGSFNKSLNMLKKYSFEMSEVED
jgi:hypothetical protein